MPTKNTRKIKNITIFFTLVMVAFVAVSIAFSGISQDGVSAYAASSNSTEGTTHTDATVESFAETLPLPASITLKARAVDENYPPMHESTAAAEVTESATITLSGKIWDAVKSGRLSAKLIASGTHTLTTVRGISSGKSASYTVSGALQGKGNFTVEEKQYENGQLVATNPINEFRDLEIAPLTTLSEANGNTITVSYTARHSAVDESSGAVATAAETTIDATMSFVLELSYVMPKVSIDANIGGYVLDVNGNKITDGYTPASEIELAFDESAKFTAVPDNGFYFMGWRAQGASTNISGTVLDLGDSTSIASGTTPTYVAQFSKINVNDEDNYVYTTTALGPIINSTAYTGVYYLTHEYSGTATDNTSFSARSEGLDPVVAGPIKAGSYVYKCDFYYRAYEGDTVINSGERMGGAEIEFTIEKNSPIVERGNNEQEIDLRLGDNLSFLDMTFKAYNSANLLVTIGGDIDIRKEGAIVDLNSLLPVSEEGSRYDVHFIPNDKDNYNEVDVPITVYVKDRIHDTGTNIEAGLRDYTVSKSIVTQYNSTVPSNITSLPEGQEVVKVSLKANMLDESGQYFFIGWRIGTMQDGVYAYSYITAGEVTRDANGDILSISGLEYDYYLPYYGDENVSEEEKELKKTASFQAVFIKDVTCGNSANEKNVTYTGAYELLTPRFSPEAAGYSFGAGTQYYYYQSEPTVAQTIAPTSIGNHTLKYEIRNTALNKTVDTRIINFNVVVGNVNVSINTTTSIAQGGYNQTTGWARQMSYTLNVQSLIASGAEHYYYSIDGGNTWQQIDSDSNTIANAKGCAISFLTPLPTDDNPCVVREYLFIATHSANGVGNIYDGYNVIAYTTVPTVAKLDTVTPTISGITAMQGGEAYLGTWTNSMINFTANASFGGSGAVIDVCYVDDGETWVTLNSAELGLSSGTDTAKTENLNVTFNLDSEYEGTVKFRIRNGSNIRTIDENIFTIKIDKTAPSFDNESSDKNVNSNGWIGGITNVTYTVSDLGGSGIKSVTASVEGTPVTVANIGSLKYRITIQDSREYAITIQDEAGNTQNTFLQKNIDIEDITYEYAEQSYVASSWAHQTAVVIYNVKVGASGARLSYSVNGGSWIPCGDGAYSAEQVGQILTDVVLEHQISPKDVEEDYSFKIQNRAGKEVIIDFGTVRFDQDNPIYTLLTDLSSFQGTEWSANNLTAEFTVFDNSAQVNSGIDENSISVDNGGVIESLGDGRYRLIIDKCTVYNLVIKDIAGNTIYETIQANVDTIMPSLELKAYVGGGNPDDIEELPTQEDNLDENLYDFESWITKSSSEPYVRIEFTINLTASGSRLEYSNNNGITWTALTPTYMPAEGEISGTISTRTYITTEQNRTYKFRLATGSGRQVVYEHADNKDLFIKLDFTAPTLRSETFRVGTNPNFPLKTTWTNEIAQYRIMTFDTALGSGVDTTSIRLNVYPYEAEDANILSGNAKGESYEMAVAGDYRTFDFSEAKKCLLTFSDKAGNAYEGEIFIPHVDLTKDFVLSVNAYVNGDKSDVLEDNEWLNEDDSVHFEGVASFQNGATGFGLSGGRMEFSLDGENWYTKRTLNGQYIEIIENGGIYELISDREQLYTYHFRLVTGAGNQYVLPNTFTVQKDTKTPTVNAVATLVTGESYSGEWTNVDVRFTISAFVGASGGSLKVGVGDSLDNVTVWEEIATLLPNIASLNNYYQVVNASVSDNFYFKVESVNGQEATTSNAILVQVDKTPIKAVIKAIEEGIEVESGTWVNSTATVYPFIEEIGESGVDSIYASVNGGEYNALEEVILDANTAELQSYIFKIISNSGMEFITAEFKLGYDDVIPTFTYDLTGSQLPASATEANRGWYISNVDVRLTIADIASGVDIYYALRKANEQEYGEWVNVDSEFVLTDTSLNGGLDAYYKFKVVSGASIENISEEIYLPIDTHAYEAKVLLSVGNVYSSEDYSFANVSGTGTYRRGDSFTVTVTPKTSFILKSLYVTVNGVRNLEANVTLEALKQMQIDALDPEKQVNKYSSDSKRFTCEGSDVILEYDYYKEIEVVYASTRQCLQAGDAIGVGFRAKEEGFDDVFGALTTSQNGVGVTVSYTDVFGGTTTKVPNEIGTYTFKLDVAEGYENYYLMNDTTNLTIVYFVGEGTLQDPYLIYTIEDFYRIDDYMYFEAGYETLDERAYLGANRRSAEFKQMCDIALPATFTPIADKSDTYTKAFGGKYNGNGYEFYYSETFAHSGDFGLFLNVESGHITNLGARYNIRLTGAQGASVGLIAAKASANSGIRATYAIGNIYVNGSGMNVGGILGSLNTGLVSYSFSDVSISVINSDGNFGGVVGKATASYTANVYTVSKISLEGVHKYDLGASNGTKFAYAGAVIGYVENFSDATSAPNQTTKSYYLDRNLSYAGSIEQGLSLGNKETFGQYDALMHQSEDINFFASSLQEGSRADELIINVQESGRQISIKQLVKVRIDSLKEEGLQGEGTTESPFLVYDADMLKYVETFPYAEFKQMNDVVLPLGMTFSTTIPFVGVYDGNGYAILNARANGEVTYGGIFGVVAGTIKNLKVLDVNFDYSVQNEVSVGAVVGLLEAGGVIDNVIATGTISVQSGENIAYVGGLVGVMRGDNVNSTVIRNSLSLVSVNVEGEKMVVGGLSAQLQGNARLERMISMSAVSIEYSLKANVGAAVGALNTDDATISGLSYLMDTAYANGKNISLAVGYSLSNTLDVTPKSYVNLVSETLGGVIVSDRLDGLYPFKGKGSTLEPFIIENYEDLTLIGNYMYASFKLADNIMIGDYNADGQTDYLDNYNYDFKPIGNGATFTGSLNGDGYSIGGLTDSLFAVNAGSVTDLTLNVSYKVYAREGDIPEEDYDIDASGNRSSYTASKVATANEDILFGAVAKINRTGGSLIRVGVNGSIYVRTSGRSKVTVGGLVGLDLGGQVVASQMTATISVRANQIVAGGVIGEIRSSEKAFNQIASNFIQITDGLDLGGANVIGGTFVGAVEVYHNLTPNFNSTTNLIVNGVNKGNAVYVGRQKQ